VRTEECLKLAFFYLPVTLDSVLAAVDSIRSIAYRLPVPFAVENGVNYLKPREDELSDGEFVSKVIEYANCGLVLDLHNAWNNEANGHQHMYD
jgi:uncharacterized protein (UPF0276 family)